MSEKTPWSTINTHKGPIISDKEFKKLTIKESNVYSKKTSTYEKEILYELAERYKIPNQPQIKGCKYQILKIGPIPASYRISDFSRTLVDNEMQKSPYLLVSESISYNYLLIGCKTDLDAARIFKVYHEKNLGVKPTKVEILTTMPLASFFGIKRKPESEYERETQKALEKPKRKPFYNNYDSEYEDTKSLGPDGKDYYKRYHKSDNFYSKRQKKEEELKKESYMLREREKESSKRTGKRSYWNRRSSQEKMSEEIKDPENPKESEKTAKETVKEEPQKGFKKNKGDEDQTRSERRRHQKTKKEEVSNAFTKNIANFKRETRSKMEKEDNKSLDSEAIFDNSFTRQN